MGSDRGGQVDGWDLIEGTGGWMGSDRGGQVDGWDLIEGTGGWMHSCQLSLIDSETHLFCP